MNLCGEVGESEYGENADIKDPLGEGSMGDFNAIIAGKYYASFLPGALAHDQLSCVTIFRLKQSPGSTAKEAQ